MNGLHEAEKNVGRVRSSEGGVEKEKDKELEVALTNASGKPYTMMIKAKNTCVTRPAVVDARGFGSGACDAVAWGWWRR